MKERLQMSLTPLTKRQQDLIVSNVVKACKDITLLNRAGYKFLSLANGFIAHYDQYGFIDFYSGCVSLKHDIIGFAGSNQWKNFREGERDYEYYKAKADVYNRILSEIL
jgi:hypothetical protein